LWIEVILFAATSFWVGLSGALVPGPMLTVTISDSLNKGFRAGPLVVLGHVIVESCLIFLLILGLGWLIRSDKAAMVIGSVGGLMLIYLGYRIARSPSPPQIPGDGKPVQTRGSVLSGIITSISNPYFFIWWATVGWAFMLKGIELAGVAGILGFLVGHWTSDLSWYSLVSFFSSKGRHILPGKRYKILMIICGIFLITLGGYFIYTAILNLI
jgi:threonine/homoserine/homoserine lactone efflux protein